MAASESVSPVELLCEQIAGASPDVLQAMIKTFAVTRLRSSIRPNPAGRSIPPSAGGRA